MSAILYCSTCHLGDTSSSQVWQCWMNRAFIIHTVYSVAISTYLTLFYIVTPLTRSPYVVPGGLSLISNVLFRGMFLDLLFWVREISLFCTTSALSALYSWAGVLLPFLMTSVGPFICFSKAVLFSCPYQIPPLLDPKFLREPVS